MVDGKAEMTVVDWVAWKAVLLALSVVMKVVDLVVVMVDQLDYRYQILS